MSDAFTYKHGARLPSRIVTLAGNGLTDLSTVDVGSIKFVYRTKGIVERKEIVASVFDSPTMKIKVDFGVVDTGTIAQYEWNIEAKVAGLPMYFPEKGFYTFSITPNID